MDNYMIQEVLLIILRELPVKSLLRFRAVSKLWCSIIDDPSFISSHTTRSYTRPGGIRLISDLFVDFNFGNNNHFRFYSIDPEGSSSYAFDDTLVGDVENENSFESVHGLVYKHQNIYNPSTKECITLPAINTTLQITFAGLYISQLKIIPHYLLGFDSVSNKYKVLHVSTISLSGYVWTEYKVLTLGGTDSLTWRTLYLPEEQHRFVTLYPDLPSVSGSGCCIDDVIFCLSYNKHFVLAFEVGPEKFRTMALPINSTDFRCYLVEIDKHLALVTRRAVKDPHYNDEDAHVVSGWEDEYAHANTSRFEVMTIWILEDYTKQIWKKKKSFVSPALEILRNEVDINIKRTWTLAFGTFHTSEVLFYSKGWISSIGEKERGKCCFYYDLETNNFRLVPKLLQFEEEEYSGPQRQLEFCEYKKQVECLVRLKDLVAAV